MLKHVPAVEPSLLIGGSLAVLRGLGASTSVQARPDLVESQLRIGIATGLLKQGDKLPAEQELARELGVSASSLRQALDRLRGDSLVRTRAGKGGGTFVSADSRAVQAMASAFLADHTSSSITDAFELLAELHSSAAYWAAKRFAASDQIHLDHVLRVLLEATTPEGRRSAGTVFSLAIASLARNESLFSSLVPQLGECFSMSWVDAVGFTDPGLNQAARDTCAAIQAGQADRAGDCARRQVLRLSQFVLDSWIAQLRASHKFGEDEVGFEALIADIECVGQALLSAAEGLVAVDPASSRTSPSAEAERVMNDLLDKSCEIVRGAGVAYHADIHPSGPLWMDWWEKGHQGERLFKAHDFNLASTTVYRYDLMEWFLAGRRASSYAVSGPFFDLGGIGAKSITVAAPVTDGPLRGSVVAADLDMHNIEARFLLSDMRPGRILVSGEGRIIASDTVTDKSGDYAGRNAHWNRVEQDSGESKWAVFIAQ